MLRLLRQILLLVRETPLAWMVVTFVAYAYYAQFVSTTRWNAIELIIAQNLLDHGAYVTSLDYPSALTWRPLLPTLLVTFVRVWVESPITIYQIVCGASLATLAATLFLAARAIWGTVAGHVAACLTFFCPALTSALINHLHSYSHLGALPFIGVAIWLSARLLARREPEHWLWYCLGGAAWGFTVWCRSELLLFALVFFAALALQHLRWRQHTTRLAMAVGAALLVVVPYHLALGQVAKRDGLLVRKPIYTMYISQGWFALPPGAQGDVEAAGYIHAKEVYGDPIENNESIVRAILRNPEAFRHRVGVNLREFYIRYVSPFFVPWWWSAAAFVMVMFSLLRARKNPDEAIPVLFLAGLFAASHFVLAFHVDERYLTINVPAVIVLATGGATVAGRWLWRFRGPWGKAVVSATALAVAVLFSRHFQNFRIHGPRNETSQLAMRSLAEHFQTTVPEPVLVSNREPHIGFVFPAESPLYGEDVFLLAYYTGTAWVFGGAEGAFPRGKFYSYRNCEDDYRYVPADVLAAGPIANMTPIAEYENPVLGAYVLLQRSQ